MRVEYVEKKPKLGVWKELCLEVYFALVDQQYDSRKYDKKDHAVYIVFWSNAMNDLHSILGDVLKPAVYQYMLRSVLKYAL